MREKQRARSKKLLKLGRMGMKELIKQPVKQAVREALAEERVLAENDDQDRTEIKEVRRRRPRQKEYDTERYDTEDRDYDKVQYDTDDDSGGGRLKSALLLLVLGVVAVAAVKKRKKLMKVVKSEKSSDEGEYSTVSNQRSTAHTDSIGRNESTSHMGEGDTDSGSDQPKEYDVDTEDEGLSTTDS